MIRHLSAYYVNTRSISVDVEAQEGGLLGDERYAVVWSGTAALTIEVKKLNGLSSLDPDDV